MNSLGTQHLVEFVNCKSEHLNSSHKLEEFMIESLEKSGLNYRKIISHKFEPVGVTTLAIISESHIAFHTYPEMGNVSLDVYTCSSPKKQEKFIKEMEKRLKPELVRIAEVQRGNTIDILDTNWIISESSIDFEIKYHVKKKLHESESPYQRIEIIENESFGRMMFLDRDLQIASGDAHVYNEAIMRPLLESDETPEKVFILGGGDGGILNTLLKKKPTDVTLIDIDKDVVEVSKKYLKKICGKTFEHPRATIVYDDVNNFLMHSEKADVMISDLTMHPESFTSLDRKTYLTRLFNKIHKKLNRGGYLTMQVCSSYDPETENLVRGLLEKKFSSVEFRKVFIPSFCEEWIFGTARK